MEVKDEVVTPFLKTLENTAKAKGIPFARENAPKLVELGLEIIDALVAQTPNKFDDLGWAAVRPELKESADKLIAKEFGE